MPKLSSLIKQLATDHPELTFIASDDFRWSPESSTVFYVDNKPHSQANLLHETAHGLLGHRDYQLDIDLLKKEFAAWQYAKDKLAPHYNISIKSEEVENALDSYRDWLHERSLCPNCLQTGLESDDKSYTCLNCQAAWRPNDARRCGLRRYIV